MDSIGLYLFIIYLLHPVTTVVADNVAIAALRLLTTSVNDLQQGEHSKRHDRLEVTQWLLLW